MSKEEELLARLTECEKEISFLRSRVETMDETLCLLRAIHVVEIAEHSASLERARRFALGPQNKS